MGKERVFNMRLTGYLIEKGVGFNGRQRGKIALNLTSDIELMENIELELSGKGKRAVSEIAGNKIYCEPFL